MSGPLSSDAGTSLRDAGVDGWLADAVARSARGTDRSLDGYLDTVGRQVALPETRATCRCHFIAADPRGDPLINALVELLVAQVVDYCIPRTRIRRAHEAFVRTGSTEDLLRLGEEARGLFTKLKTSGEGGEMLLYLLLEIVLGMPQLLCKMPLKTDANMHVHGTDGIHGRVLDDGTLALYWCESKLYADASAAIDACLAGLAPFLAAPGGEESERDVVLLREGIDLGDQRVSDALRRYFQPGTLESRRVLACGAGLVGFSLADYPSPFGDDRTKVTAEVSAMIERWHSRISTQIAAQRLSALDIEVFCVPFPDVQDFRDRLRAKLGL